MDNPWKGPGAPAQKLPEMELRPPVGVPDVTDPVAVARETVQDLLKNPLGYLLAGLAYMAMVLAGVSIAIGALGVGIAPGMALEDEILLAVGGSLGFAVYTGVIFGIVLFLYPMMSASLMMALREQRTGGASIGLRSAFDRMWSRMGPAVRIYLLTQLLALVGMFFLYIPGLIAMAVGTFAFPIVVFEEVGAMEAIQIAWAHVRKHIGWHAVVWVLLFALIIVVELTFVGVLVLWPIMCCYQLVAYEKAFGAAGAAAWRNQE